MNYVPVKSDMSDLTKQIAWCRSHPDKCEAIARDGKALADSMKLESELRDAGVRLDRLFG